MTLIESPDFISKLCSWSINKKHKRTKKKQLWWNIWTSNQKVVDSTAIRNNRILFPPCVTLTEKIIVLKKEDVDTTLVVIKALRMSAWRYVHDGTQ